MPGIRSQACLLLLAVGLGLPVDASERTLRVAVLGKSPPMAFVDAAGKLAGFNVRVAHALCDAMSVRCELTATPLERVVDAVAAGEFDFAAVSLLDTAERRSRILFSKPYYRSSSIWFARPEVEPGRGLPGFASPPSSAAHNPATPWRTAGTSSERCITPNSPPC